MNHFTRRRVLQQLSILASSTLVLPFGCKESIPNDITISRIVQFKLRGKRPKYVGKNSQRDDHTEYGNDTGVLVYTSNGLTGVGTHRGDEKALTELLGKNLLDWYLPEEKKINTGDRNTMAFWDILGKHYKKPVWQLLGTSAREKVPLYDGTIYFQDLIPEHADSYMDQFKKEFDMGYEAGHMFFKMKVGRGFQWMEKEAGYQRDIEILAASREYIGTDIQIGVDANNGLDLESSKQMLRDLPDFNFAFMEEMFPEEVALDVEFKNYIKENGWDTLVADFESMKEVESFLPFMEAKCIDVMQGDMNQFGIEGIMAEAAIGKPYGGRVAPHNWGSMLGYYCQLHLGKVIENWYMAEQDWLTSEVLIPEGYQVKDGFTTVSEAPGFGLTVVEEKLEAQTEILYDRSV
ncbi:MAG: enolase C-terminal domain-like protein [Cyclobacteriaceae bacterium]